MATNESPLSLLLSLYPGNGLTVVSRHKLMDYAVREFNFLLWLALIFITVFLLKKLVWMFEIRLKGDRHCSLFSRDDPVEDLTGKRQ